MDLNKVDRNFSFCCKEWYGEWKSAPELKHLVMDKENVECLDTISSHSSLLISVLPALCPLRWAGCVTAAWSKQALGWKAGEGNSSLSQTAWLRSRQGCEVSEFGAGEGKCPAEAEIRGRRVPSRSEEGKLKLRRYQDAGRDRGPGLLGRSEPCRNGVWLKSCCTPPSAFLQVVLVLRVTQDAGRGQSLPWSLLALPAWRKEFPPRGFEVRRCSQTLPATGHALSLLVGCFQWSQTTQTQGKELIPSLGMTIVYLRWGEGMLFTAGTESCLKQQHLSNLTDLFFTGTLQSQRSLSFCSPHWPFPLLQDTLSLLELFPSSLLMAYTTYLATAI